jgi:capsular polysaccharide biosynthesis protein
MSQQEQGGQATGGFDPEAEQEVDFSRYVRLLAVRWWLIAAGLVAGAVIGYAVSLGGSQVYKASATVYLGQPYSAGGSPVATLQQNPSAVNAIVESSSAIRQVATLCKAKPADFRNGISTAEVAGSISRTIQNPVMRITVQGKHAKEVACAADGLAHKVVDRIGLYAQGRIENFRRRITTDEDTVSTIKTSIASPQVSTTDKLLFQLQLRNFQEDDIAAQQLLLQAEQIEAPKVLTTAVAQRVTARSRRNTVVVAALIGLILGALAALFWDRVAAKLPRSDEE